MLRTHIERRHEKNRPFECEVKDFYSKSQMKIHIFGVHCSLKRISNIKRRINLSVVMKATNYLTVICMI